MTRPDAPLSSLSGDDTCTFYKLSCKSYMGKKGIVMMKEGKQKQREQKSVARSRKRENEVVSIGSQSKTPARNTILGECKCWNKGVVIDIGTCSIPAAPAESRSLTS